MADPRYGLTDWQAGADNPNVAVNELAAKLLTGLHGVLRLRTFQSNSPPVSPVAGEWYYTGTSPTGDWAGFPSHLAFYSNSGWQFVAIQGDELVINEANGNALQIFDGTAFSAVKDARFVPGTVHTAWRQSGQGNAMQRIYHRFTGVGPSATYTLSYGSLPGGLSALNRADTVDAWGSYYNGTVAGRIPRGADAYVEATASGIVLTTGAGMPSGCTADIYVEGVFS